MDSTAPQVESVRGLGLEAYVMCGEELPFREEFVAVFSNAVLPWIEHADALIEGVYRSLRRRGVSSRDAEAMGVWTEFALR